MNLWNSSTYRKDVMRTANTLDLDRLCNKRILITGASGLIGSAIVDLLLWWNKEKQANITIYAGGRDLKKLEKRFPCAVENLLTAIAYDATAEVHFDFDVDFIVHAASNASPDRYITEPVGTLLANVVGISNLLQFAESSHTERTVYISSSEVYGKLNQQHPLTEDVYGEVDVLSVRSAYPLGKRAAENLCVAYASQYGTDVSIVRPGHIYGPTAQPSDNRVSSAFAYQAAYGKDIVMKSEGTQLRSYCYCLDCAAAVLTVLLKGEKGQAYNISNRKSIITIRKMAELLASSAGVRLLLDLPTYAEKTAFNPMSNSSLDSKKLEDLGWNGIFDAEEGFFHTIQILREIK